MTTGEVAKEYQRQANRRFAQAVLAHWAGGPVPTAATADADPEAPGETLTPKPSDEGSSATEVGSPARALPTIPSEPVLVLDPASLATRNLLASAQEIARKWRFDLLNELAVKATDEVIGIESNVLKLMDLALTKFSHAQQLLNPVLLETVRDLNETIKKIGIEIGGSADIGAAIDQVAEAASSALLLDQVVTFLAKTEPFEFWLGLFGALFDDVAAADPNAPFQKTSTYLDTAFASLGITTLAEDLVQRLDHEVDQLVKPLADAVAGVIASLNQATGEAFDSFDLPLVARRSQLACERNAPGLNPLASVAQDQPDHLAVLEAQLRNAVERLASEIKRRMRDAVTGTAQQTRLFRELTIAYLVLPILAFLLIAVAGGPFAAAALAAVVLLGAQELLHLVARWLSGPLRKELDEAKQRVLEGMGSLQQAFAREAALVEDVTGDDYLRILADELLALKDLAPEAFLDGAAAILHEARDVLMYNAVQLALAAERALGLESGTAFDAISYGYRSTLTALAPLLPGGADASLFSGVALRRDLGRLEQQRAALLDDKELEITHRISLLQLLGGDPAHFLTFLRNRTMLVDIKEEDVLDRKFPGMYRALIKEVKVFGVFDTPVASDPAAPLPWSQSIPVILKHLGPSRTRVKRNANPAAPPLDLPECLPGREACLTELLQAISAPRPPESPFPDVPGLLGESLSLWQNVNSRDGVAPAVGGREAASAWVSFVPNALAQAVKNLTCTVVDPTTVHATATEILKDVLRRVVREEETLSRPKVPVEEVVESDTSDLINELDDIDFAGDYPMGSNRVPVRQAKMTLKARREAVNRQKDRLPPPPPPETPPKVPRDRARDWALAALHNGVSAPDGELLIPGVSAVFRHAYDAAVAFRHERIGKWGDAVLELDKKIVDWANDPNKLGKPSKVDALGFVTLKRDMPEEVAIFNLFPPNTSFAPRLASQPATSTDGAPLRHPSTLQYRPFENRGLEGQLLVSLPEPPPIPPAPGPHLSDLVLEVTFRGCFDSDLAASVGADRKQTMRGLDLGAKFGGILLPSDGRGRVDVGTTELRTVQFSLRTHRDRTLLSWIAGVEAWRTTHPLGPPPPSPVGQAPNFSPHRRDEPLLPLPGGNKSVTLQFFTDDSLSAPKLDELPGRIPVVRSDLDFLSIAPALDGSVVRDPELVGLGVAVIPTAAGARSSDPGVLRLLLRIDDLLSPLVPGFSTTPSPLTRRLVMTPPNSRRVKLEQVWAASPKITLDYEHSITKGLLYDIVFSLTFSVPALLPRPE